jgi:demethylmenaquinone methyltransferase/2-methoxy-6-polyprenyl-1,4-benzoquinol methylase
MQKDPKKIQEMFGTISPWYDFLNHGCSAGMDHLWRRCLLAEVKSRRNGDIQDALDLCCGSGDVTFLFAREASTNLRKSKCADLSVVGLDFTPELLAIAEKKAQRFTRNHEVTPLFIKGDAMNAPLPNVAFDAITIAFGLRNLEDLDCGLREMARLLRPGGVLGILEFGHISNPLIRRLFMIYFGRVMPALGRILTGSSAYAYLRDSCLAFPRARKVGQSIKTAGLHEVRCVPLSYGIANVFTAVKPVNEDAKTE